MNWLLFFIKIIWAKVSPELREKIVDFVKDLEKKASETENQFDDFAIQVLKYLLGIT